MNDVPDKSAASAQIDAMESLPVPAYVVSSEGVFLYCNQLARKLFKLDTTTIAAGEATILAFYHDPLDRERLKLLANQAAIKGAVLERQRVHFCIDGEDVFLEMRSTLVRDAQNHVVAYTDCVLDITQEAKYSHLLDSLSEGVYDVDESGRFLMVNMAVARLFGFGGTEEIIGTQFSQLFSDPTEFAALRDRVDQHTSTDVAWRLRRRDGGHFFASIVGHAKYALDGTYLGLEGTIRDVTRSEQYRQIISAIPLGFYMLERRGDEDFVQSCNAAFARFFGYESEDQIVGQRMRDLHADSSKYGDFVARIEQADQEGSRLSVNRFPIRTHNGSTPIIEVTCELLHDHEGEIIGRVGVIRDVTDEEPLRQQIKELTSDIGNLLHSYSSTLHTVVTSLAPGIETLLRNPADHLDLQKGQLLERIKDEMRLLAVQVFKFADTHESPHTRSVFSLEQWEQILRMPERVSVLTVEVAHPEMIVPSYYELAREIHDLFYVQRRLLERTSVRTILSQSWSVERLCSLYALLRAKDAAVTMDYSTRALREYVIRSERPEEHIADYKVTELIASAIHNVADFARERRIHIDRRGISRSTAVRVVEREMVRAIANLLHNAIKYSWMRESKEPWIEVRAAVEQPPGRSGVRIEIVNFGVPIPADEISKGLIFRFGFRGRLAAERRRTGTGVGLTDAREVIKRHGGELSLTSRPATPGASTDDYSQPFITTATVFLPVSNW